MKKILIVALTFAFTICMSINSLAGAWQQDKKGYWYVKDDGSYPTNAWMTIDGKEYYFAADGYMLANTVTPDGFTVDASGAKTYITPAPVTTQAAPAQTSVTQTGSSSGTVQTSGSGVYITETGKKYHIKPNCGTSNASKAREASVEEAQALGLEPCMRCFR